MIANHEAGAMSILHIIANRTELGGRTAGGSSPSGRYQIGLKPGGSG